MNLKVKVGDRFFEVEVEDVRARPIRAIIEDEVFEVWPELKAAYTIGGGIHLPVSAATFPPMQGTTEGAIPLALPQPTPKPAGNGAAQMGKTVRAPIPGVITAITVHPGDEVSPGQELCKLEAMKMNNSIRANRAGKIEAINISVGQQVKHNEPLMEYAK